jgi:hydroxymethylpyrimidine pyrophosphatase-like HAD family hydrolase
VTLTPYSHSSALAKIKHSLATDQAPRLAFLDIDDTLTGPPAEQKQLRQLLEAQSYVITFVTSRPLEMCLSWAAQTQSEPAIKNRPPAKFKLKPTDQFHQLHDPASLASLSGLIDPDFIAGATGTEIALRDESGRYHLDTTYQPPDSNWRQKTFALLRNLLIKHNSTGSFASMEFIDNYQQGISSVLPLTYRLQLNFSSHADQQKFYQLIYSLPLAVADDSNPYHHPPNYNLIITPQNFQKHQAAHHILQQLTQLLNLNPENLEILIAGDAPVDLPLGLKVAPHSHVTFLIPGGARLGRYLKDNNTTFISPDLLPYFKLLQNPVQQIRNQQLILGDEAYPGTTGPTTLLAYLQDKTPSK